MMKIRKSISLLMISALVGMMFVGCGKSGTVNTDGGKTSKVDSSKSTGELTEISVMLFDRGNIPAGQGTVDNNQWTQYINKEMEKQGIKVNFVLIPRSEENTKIPVMMASGTAADIMMTYNSSIVEKWYKEGGIKDISKELKEYGPQIIDYVGQDVLNYGVGADGGQYAIPARRSITASFNGFIRKDWLEKLGLAVPKNIDELFNVLMAFKQQDPGNIGKDKLYPLAYSKGDTKGNLFTSFIKYEDEATYRSRSIALPSGSETGHAYATDKFRGYYEFLNKAYNNGLMDPEFFTSQFDQKEKEGVVAGKIGYWDTNVGANVDPLRGGLLQNLRATVPDADFVAIPALENINDGKKYVDEYPLTGAFVFIPQTAKHPDACIKYLNFLAGEGGKTLWFGFEGTHYEVVDGVPVPKDAELNAQELDWIHHDTFLVGNQGYFKTEKDFIKATAKSLPEFEQYLTDDYTLALDGIRLTNTTYKSPTEVEQAGNLDKVNEDYKVKLITAKPEEFDALYKQYIAELEKYDIAKIIEERYEHFSKQAK